MMETAESSISCVKMDTAPYTNHSTLRASFIKWGRYSKAHSRSKIGLIIHRLYSISHSFLLYREQSESGNINNDYCWFKIMDDDESLFDCSEFDDAEIYVPIYSQMIKNGNMVVFGYRKDDNRCFIRACVQLHGDIISDGCLVKKLEKNEGYIHYVLCNPSDRGHGGHNSIISFICNKLDSYELYSIVKIDNIPSLKGFYRNGFRRIALLSQYNILGLRRLIRKEV